MLLLLIGYSLSRAVSYNSYVTNFTVTKDAYGYISQLPFMFSASLGILVAATLIFLFDRIHVLQPLRLNYLVPALMIALCYVAGSVFEGYSAQPFFLEFLGFVWGFTKTMLTTTWIELFTHEESPKVVILQLACASFFSAVIGVLLALFSAVFNAVICIILILACIPIIRSCRRQVLLNPSTQQEPSDVKSSARRKLSKMNGSAQREPSPAKAPLRRDLSQVNGSKQQSRLAATFKASSTAILAYFFFELVVGLINMFAYEGSSTFSISTNAPIQGMLICSILVILFVFITSKTPSPSLIYLFVFPIIISVFLALPFFGESLGRPMSSVIYAAYVFTSVLTTFCYVRAIRETNASAYQVAALVSGGVRIMLMIGIGLGYVFSSALEAEAYMRLSIAAVSCVYFLGVVILFVLWNYRNSRKQESRPSEVAPAPSCYEEYIASRIEALVKVHRLTKRERDVLIGLSRGYSAARIAKDLFISTNTAQGYIKTLYVKLGVNKKQQVLDLFDEAKQQ